MDGRNGMDGMDVGWAARGEGRGAQQEGIHTQFPLSSLCDEAAIQRLKTLIADKNG